MDKVKWVGWFGLTALATAGMVLLRGQLGEAHVALLYLLVVLWASARGGRTLGMALAVVTFLSFNFFFLPPYHSFTVAEPLDWIVLFAYLTTAAVAAQLLSRAQREASERIRLAEEAEQARVLRETDRLKDALIAAVSHDLRTPLTTIKALAHELGAQGDERALIIAQEADRLARLVTDLLDFSGLRGGALVVRPEVNAVEDVLGAAIQQVSGAFPGRELKASIDTTEPVLLARLDFVHTLRIVVNLLENAHKYSPLDRPIELSARREGSLVTIVVADRGPGVPQHERERIFQPFYRLPGTSADSNGAGLGLAIAAGLTQAQNGTLRCEPRPGGGTLFLLSFPVAELPDIRGAPSVS